MKSGQLYTLATWTVKPGKEAEFIESWQAFADWTTNEMEGAGEGTLLQQEDNSLRFVSFGPWQEQAVVDHWRQQPTFKAFIKRARELCQELEPHNMVQVGYSNRAA